MKNRDAAVINQTYLKYMKTTKRKRSFFETFELTLLALPAILYFLLFHYVPMFGLVIAFKDYRYDLGILGSKWAGFKNFEFFFASEQALRVTRNTVMYGVIFTITGLVAAMIVALLLFQITNKPLMKTYQTAMIIPNFMSWVMGAFIFYIILNPTSGVLSQVSGFLGLPKINFYSDPGYWPVILTIANLWKHIGLSSIMYYAGLMGIDKELYEAAEIDGAGKIRQTISISIPHLVPLMTILTILAIGNLFRGEFGMFYNVPRNMGMLYSTTDIIDTYIYRGLIQIGDIGMTSAVGFFQSITGLILIIFSNGIARKINPENSLF